MPCYHPLFAIISPNSVTGKNNVKILKQSDVDSLYFKRGSDWIEDHITTLPCGKCIGCRLDYSRKWADRIMLEAQYHDESYFCTFTYDDAALPRAYYSDKETGEARVCATLRPKDMQDFFKRLRKSGQKVRYYMCGEYGSSTMRPHYHAIIFGLHLDDLEFYSKNPQGDLLYNSPTLSSLWSHGHVVIGDLDWNSAAYVARYTMKKANGNYADVYKEFNIVPEFVRMSRRPGIGRLYYDEHKEEIYKYDDFYLSTEHGGVRVSHPRYFDELYSLENPDRVKQLKEKRLEAAVQARKFRYAATDEYRDFILPKLEDLRQSKIKILKERSKPERYEASNGKKQG